MPIAPWDEARNILCVRLDTLGDVLMTEPALRALKQAVPDRRLSLLTSPSGAEAAPLMAAVDDLVVYSAPWMKATPEAASSCNDRCLQRALRGRRFSAAVIFTCFSQSPLPAAMLCYLADIPLRLAHCRENPYQLLTHWVPEREPEQGIRHEVQRQLDLVRTVGSAPESDAIELIVPPSAVRNAELKLRRRGVDPAAPWIVVHVGATAPSRRWPPEFFSEAADQLASQLGAQIVFTGSASERQLVHQVQSQMLAQSSSLAGDLSVSQLAGLLSLAPLLVSNNTGPVHLAAGLKTPVVDIYALTNPQHTPWRTPSRVLSFDVACKNCFRSICPEGHHQCLRGVSPDRVAIAAIDLWNETQSTESRWARAAG